MQNKSRVDFIILMCYNADKRGGMMKNNSIAWFFIKHRILARILIVYPSVVAIILCGQFIGIHIAIAAVVAVLVGTLISIAIMSAPMVLMREPVERYNNGDPRPLLQITYDLLQFKLEQPYLLAVNINRCAALSSIGEFERVIEELTNLNIEANPRATIYTKYIYYNNLADAYFSVNEHDKGAVWYEKSAQLFGAMKEGRLKESHRSIFMLSTAEYHISKGEYERCLELLCGVEAKTDKIKASVAFISAEAHIGIGDVEQAKKDLMLVVSYGKDIHIVKRARELLDELGKDSAKKSGAVENQK